MSLLLAPVLILYSIFMSVMIVYIFNLLYLGFVAWRNQKNQIHIPSALPNPLPRITVQLPIYNELYVAERLIRSAAALNYPKELLEIQALDDSTDETSSIISGLITRLKSDGINIVHIRRKDRTGFKAGALANGLALTQAEYLAIFDADFLPAPDFLLRALPYLENEKTAFVQTRWGHLNRNYSMLTLFQALALDAHFAIDQFARSSFNYIFNFNGTAGIWRKSAIIDSGGWQADTLTEDLDLSYRAFLRGWSARYANEIEAPAELPVSFAAYRLQQYRWARGSLECAIKHIPAILRSDFPLSKKFQSVIHLTGYGMHLIAFALMTLYPSLIYYSIQYPSIFAPLGFGLLMNALALVPVFYFIAAQIFLKRKWLVSLPLIFLLSSFSFGLILNTLRAALHIAQKFQVPFERTPKHAIIARSHNWLAHRYQVRLDPLIFFEFALALVNLNTVFFAWRFGYFFLMIYAFLFALGLIWFPLLTLAQTFSARVFSSPAPDSN